MSNAPWHFQAAFRKKSKAGGNGKLIDTLTNSWLVVGTCVLIVLALEMLG